MEDFGSWSDSDLQGGYDAAAAINSSVGLGEQRTTATVTTDALRTQTPVTTSGQGNQFGGLWQALSGAVGTVAATELTRYQRDRLASTGNVSIPSVASDSATQQQLMRAAQQRQAQQLKLLLLVAGVGLVGYMLAKH